MKLAQMDQIERKLGENERRRQAKRHGEALIAIPLYKTKAGAPWFPATKGLRHQDPTPEMDNRLIIDPPKNNGYGCDAAVDVAIRWISKFASELARRPRLGHKQI